MKVYFLNNIPIHYISQFDKSFESVLDEILAVSVGQLNFRVVAQAFELGPLTRSTKSHSSLKSIAQIHLLNHHFL